MLTNLVCNTGHCYCHRLLAQKSSEVLDEIEDPTLQSKLKVRGTTLVCMVLFINTVKNYYFQYLFTLFELLMIYKINF